MFLLFTLLLHKLESPVVLKSWLEHCWCIAKCKLTSVGLMPGLQTKSLASGVTPSWFSLGHSLTQTCWKTSYCRLLCPYVHVHCTKGCIHKDGATNCIKQLHLLNPVKQKHMLTSANPSSLRIAGQKGAK